MLAVTGVYVLCDIFSTSNKVYQYLSKCVLTDK